MFEQKMQVVLPITFVAQKSPEYLKRFRYSATYLSMKQSEDGWEGSLVVQDTLHTPQADVGEISMELVDSNQESAMESTELHIESNQLGFVDGSMRYQLKFTATGKAADPSTAYRLIFRGESADELLCVEESILVYFE